MTEGRMNTSSMSAAVAVIQMWRQGNGADLQEAIAQLEQQLEHSRLRFDILSTLVLEVPCLPVGQPRARSSRKQRGLYTPDKKGELRAFKEAVLRVFRSKAGADVIPHAGPVLVSIDAFFPRTKEREHRRFPAQAHLRSIKPDSDNVEKAVLDALTITHKLRKANRLLARDLRGYPWVDDSQVHVEGVYRWWVERGTQPGVIITIHNIAEKETQHAF